MSEDVTADVDLPQQHSWEDEQWNSDLALQYGPTRSSASKRSSPLATDENILPADPLNRLKVLRQQHGHH